MNAHQCTGARFRALVLATLLAISALATAATVRHLGISDLLEGSELVIHGQVAERWVEYDEDSDTVFTAFRIEVTDTIKGAPAANDVVIRFTGGTWEGRTLVVSDMQMPIVGEEGIYFIERTGARQVHPLLGWDQGRFLVRYSGDGDKRIVTSDLRPVYDLAPASHSNVIDISAGVAKGVDTDDTKARRQMTVSTFKDALRSIMEDQQ